MKLPALKDPTRYAGLYVVDFGEQPMGSARSVSWYNAVSAKPMGRRVG